MMKTKSPVLVLFLTSLLAFSGACDGSKAELLKTRKDLKEVTAERDEAKAKLERIAGPLESLQHENAELREKVAAAAAAQVAAEAKADRPKSKKKTAAHSKRSKKKKKSKT